MKTPSLEIQLASTIEGDEIEIEVIREGEFNHPWFGVLPITKKKLASFKRNFKNNTLKKDIALDYSHKSHEEAAAWFVGIRTELRPDGLERLLAKVKLTPAGKQKIVDKEFRYISADFTDNYIDNESGEEFGPTLYGAGLTNIPFVKNMEPVIQLQEPGQLTEIKPTQGANNMEEVTRLKNELAEMRRAFDDMKHEHKTLSDAGLTVKSAMERIEAQTDEIKTLSVDKAGLEKKIKDQEKETAFTVLLSQGKACPAQKEAYLAGDMVKFAELASDKKIQFAPGGHGDGKGGEADYSKFGEHEAREEIDKLTEKKLSEMSDLSERERASKYSEVYMQVRKENPELEKASMGQH